jgi:hypothetical protein
MNVGNPDDAFSAEFRLTTTQALKGGQNIAKFLPNVRRN